MDLLFNIGSAYPDVLLQIPVHINILISEFLVRRKVLVPFFVLYVLRRCCSRELVLAMVEAVVLLLNV